MEELKDDSDMAVFLLNIWTEEFDLVDMKSGMKFQPFEAGMLGTHHFTLFQMDYMADSIQRQ